MLIVISLKNTEKMFFIKKKNVHIAFLFSSGPTTRCFLNSKMGRSLLEGLN